MNLSDIFCPLCGKKMPINSYFHSATCYDCDLVFGRNSMYESDKQLIEAWNSKHKFIDCHIKRV